jgi:rhamnose transport system substrate-binding protein/rhamnose transport system permease protein
MNRVTRRQLLVSGAGVLLALPACRGQQQQSGARTITIAMMPKNKGNPYFATCRVGADEAAKALDVRLLWDGPTETDPAKQNEVVEAWITRGVDVIAVSVENKEAMATVLRKARGRGIKVITWDADTEPDARDLFVNQATPRGIAEALVSHADRLLGGKGEFAIVTASLTAANQNDWIKNIRAVLAEKHPGLTIADIRPSDDDRQRAFEETQTLLKVHPNVKLVMAIASPAVPGAAEAVKQSGRQDVKVTGLGLPSAARPYLKEGVLDSAVLWNPRDLGYLTIYTAHALATGAFKPGVTSLSAGRLGTVRIDGDNVILGVPFTFTKDNVDQFDF